MGKKLKSYLLYFPASLNYCTFWHVFSMLGHKCQDQLRVYMLSLYWYEQKSVLSELTFIHPCRGHCVSSSLCLSLICFSPAPVSSGPKTHFNHKNTDRSPWELEASSVSVLPRIFYSSRGKSVKTVSVLIIANTPLESKHLNYS